MSFALLALFVLSLAGQIVAGQFDLNDELREHGLPAIGLAEYVRSGHFIEALFENWESEFLQMAAFVLLTTFLFQKGSVESKRPDVKELVDADPHTWSDKDKAPWPVRRGSAILWLYKRSLSFALLTLFLLSLVLHAIGGAWHYNQEQALEGSTERVTALSYLATSRFWFESFQNWQSEFLSIGAMVVLTIFLCQRGSPESKPVAAPHSDTGE